MVRGWHRAFGIDPNDPDTNAVVHGGNRIFSNPTAALTRAGARYRDGDGRAPCL